MYVDGIPADTTNIDNLKNNIENSETSIETDKETTLTNYEH